MLCFLRGWNAQLEVWQLIGSERLGGFAPVKVSDQAIYSRIERAAMPLQWLAGTRERLAAGTSGSPLEDRRLAPWATAVYAADASTLDQMSRFLPWLRQLSEGDARLLAGQISALFDVRLQQARARRLLAKRS